MSLTAQTWLAASLICWALLLVMVVGLAVAAWVNERRMEREEHAEMLAPTLQIPRIPSDQESR